MLRPVLSSAALLALLSAPALAAERTIESGISWSQTDSDDRTGFYTLSRYRQDGISFDLKIESDDFTNSSPTRLEADANGLMPLGAFLFGPVSRFTWLTNTGSGDQTAFYAGIGAGINLSHDFQLVARVASETRNFGDHNLFSIQASHKATDNLTFHGQFDWEEHHQAKRTYRAGFRYDLTANAFTSVTFQHVEGQNIESHNTIRAGIGLRF